MKKKLKSAVTHIGAIGIGIATGTAISETQVVPPLPTEAETQLVAAAMDSPIMAANLKTLVMQVQQGNDWSTLACDDMLPQFMQQWSYALGREAVRRGWKVGYAQGRDGTRASEAQFMALGPPDPVEIKAQPEAQEPDPDWKAEAQKLRRQLRTQGMKLRKLEHIEKQLAFRLPLNDNDGKIEQLNLWMMGESIRDMMWHVIRPYLEQTDPEQMDLAKEDITRAIDSQGQAVTHDLIMAGWHYGYAAAQDTPVIWPQIHGVYKEWAVRYNAFTWERPSLPATSTGTEGGG